MDIFKMNIRAAKWVTKQSAAYFPVMLLSSLFNNLIPFINIFMSAQIINEISGERRVDTLIRFVVITLLLNFIIGLLSALLARITRYTTMKFSIGQTKALMKKFLMTDFEELENGKMMGDHWLIWQASRVNEFGIEAMLKSVKQLANNVINVALSLTGIISIIFVISNNREQASGFVLIAMLFSLLICFVLLSFRNAKKLAQLGEEIAKEGKKQNIVSDIFNGDSIYQAGKDYRMYNMKQIIDEYRHEKIEILKRNNKKYFCGRRNTQIPEVLLSHSLTFVIYLFVALNALAGVFGIGSVVLYVGFIQRFISAVKEMAINFSMFRMNHVFLTNYLNFYQTFYSTRSGKRLIEKTDKYVIEFKNVSFKYAGAQHYSLKNFDMKIENGKRMAIVGMNGSGKTTMIKLLCRLYDPTEGIITLNGIDIREYDYNEYMALYSVVFQDFELFAFSLGQNISAAAEYDLERAEKALQIVGFDDRLEKMPKRLETPIYKNFEKDGVEISGGEAQKIALARAIYKNAPFIVLDEPTAALDPVAEFEIYSRFNEIASDKTAIYISHRLSSCRFCDDVAVFHEGELIQRGNHDELIKNTSGKYFELWNAQAQYYAQYCKTPLGEFVRS